MLLTKIGAKGGVITANPLSKDFMNALIAEVSKTQGMKMEKVEYSFKTHLVSTQGGEKIKGTWNWSLKVAWEINAGVPKAVVTLGPVTWKKGE